MTHLKTKTLFLGGGQFFAVFYFRESLETQPLRKARDDCIHLFIIIVPVPIVPAPCLHSNHVPTPMLLGITWPHETSPTGLIVTLTVRCSFVLLVKLRTFCKRLNVA